MFNYKIFKDLTFEQRQAYINRIQDAIDNVSWPAREAMGTAHDVERKQDALDRANALEAKLSEWVYWSNR